MLATILNHANHVGPLHVAGTVTLVGILGLGMPAADWITGKVRAR